MFSEECYVSTVSALCVSVVHSFSIMHNIPFFEYIIYSCFLILMDFWDIFRYHKGCLEHAFPCLLVCTYKTTGGWVWNIGIVGLWV